MCVNDRRCTRVYVRVRGVSSVSAEEFRFDIIGFSCDALSNRIDGLSLLLRRAQETIIPDMGRNRRSIPTRFFRKEERTGFMVLTGDVQETIDSKWTEYRFEILLWRFFSELFEKTFSFPGIFHNL